MTKKIISLLFAVILCALTAFTATAADYGDNVIDDHFELKSLAGDVNCDGYTDILDFIRLKKYTAGAAVEVDLEAAALDTTEGVTATDLVPLKKILLGVNG